MLITILAAVFFIGLPMLTGNGGLIANSNQTAAEITPIPELTIAALTVIPTPVSGALVPCQPRRYPQTRSTTFRSRKTRLLQVSR